MNKFFSIPFRGACALLALSLLSSCGPKVRRMDCVFSDQIDLERPVKDCKVNLYHTGREKFPAGVPAKLSIALRNTDAKQLLVREWYANPPENIILEYQPWYAHLEEPEPGKWETIATVPGEKSKHYQLVLEPNNVAIVDIELPFVKKMRPGPYRRFFMRARLSLKSIKAETPVFSIIVY